MLVRLLSWAGKVVGLSEIIGSIRDSRQRPRISTATVVQSIVVLFLVRLGSLNALEQTRRSRWWRRRLGTDLPSADSLGRIASVIDPATLRSGIQALYARLKRAKALGATSHGLTALVLDGHESSSSYLRCCKGCLERRVKTKQGYKTQYYHRGVTAMLLTKPFPLLLDIEPLEGKDDEIGAAVRLLERLLIAYPRAFDVVLGDALYTDPRIYGFLLRHGKDVLTVLKRNTPELLADFSDLVADMEPTVRLDRPRGDLQVWDFCGFTSWTAVDRPLRVVRSSELVQVLRQLDKATENVLSQWTWVTTLSHNRAVSVAVVELGHARWLIENRGFNETVNHWHVDHLYRHEPAAILTFVLLCMVAYNLFHGFYFRNLNPRLRSRNTFRHIAACLRTDLYGLLPSPPRPP